MRTPDYARIFRRSWLIIALAAIAGVIDAWAVTATITPTYSATSAAFVSSESGGTLNELTQSNAFTERRVNTYAKLLKEPIVTERVIEDFGLGVSPAAFAEKVSVGIPVDTTLLEVTVSDPSRSVSASLANALIASLAEVVAEIETRTLAAAAPGVDPATLVATPPVKITQVRFAEIPVAPVSPNLPLNLLLGLLGGLAIGVLVAIVRDLVDTRVRSIEDVESVASQPIVGTIPTMPKARAGGIVVFDDAGDPAAESFRILRTNLQFLDIGGPATFVVTSPGGGAGKSTVATNLAASIAVNGLRVLIVEADLRRPQVHAFFGIEGAAGLTDVLIGRAKLEDVLQTGRTPNLHILAAGRIPPNPSELLGSTQMSELMARLQDEYDVVLYDTPPVLPVPDAAILARAVGGVLLVTSIDRTRRDEIRRAVAALEKVNARVAGLVVNRVARWSGSAYVTESYHSFDRPQSEPDDALARHDALPRHDALDLDEELSTQSGWTEAEEKAPPERSVDDAEAGALAPGKAP